jgi:rhodanese-related sulfurtransferase
LDFDSVRAAQQLMEMGFPQVMVLKGGYGAWKRMGYPTEPKNYKK